MNLDSWVYRGFHATYDNQLSQLAMQLPPEKWSIAEKNDMGILRNYLAFTFEKLYSEREFASESEKDLYIYEDNEQACFNTGLLDKNWQPIYYYCVLNNKPDHQKWFFRSFHTPYTIKYVNISAQAIMSLRRPNYFQNPADLVFDIRLQIVPQWDHILDDPENFSRISESIRINGKDFCRNVISGAIDNVKKRIETNYKTAVPQWYKDTLQLLAPLYLTNPNVPDLALVMTKSEDKSQYYGHTCLTIEMAYNNARLIARPESFWLNP